MFYIIDNNSLLVDDTQQQSVIMDAMAIDVAV
jgi:hypothetical protein